MGGTYRLMNIMKAMALIFFALFILSGIGCRNGEEGEIKTYEDPVTDEGRWLLNKINVIDTVDPSEEDMADLKPFSDVCGTVQIVGLGEATHGTSEFFRMKHRIFKTLVLNSGFRLYILEQDLITTWQLNNYIVKNQGTANTWYRYIPMKEYYDLIEWMHFYNMGKSDPEKIWIGGCDMLSYNQHIEYVRNTLKTKDPDLHQVVSPLYDRLSSYSSGFVYHDEAPEQDKVKIREDIRKARDAISARKEHLVMVMGQWEYDLLDRVSLVVIQSEDFYSHKDFPAVRDKYMFDNLVWMIEKFGHAKTVHSSHNEHVSNRLRDDIYNREWDSTGFFLREKYGGLYLNLAFTFYEGSFHMYYGKGEVGPPPVDSYEYFFEQAKRPVFALNLRTLDDTGAGGYWVAGPRMFRHIDERFTAEMPIEDQFNVRPLPQDFDWIIYIKYSTPYK